MSFAKKLLRRVGRLYLTYTPIHLGRYPIMEAIQRVAAEPVYETVKTKDRGIMRLRLDDWVQYCLYYNLYEPKYENVMHALLAGARSVLDIGANIGQYSLLFASKARHVYAFEPMPELAAQLRENVRLNGAESVVRVEEVAVSDKSDTVTIFAGEASNSGMASLIGSTSGRTLTVRSIIIDEYVKQLDIRGVDLVKMDIEGAELYALRGMPELLRAEQPALVLEMNEKMMRAAGYEYKEVLEFLEPFGYKAFAITKQGLVGPLKEIHSVSENFAFLTSNHLAKQRIQKVIT